MVVAFIAMVLSFAALIAAYCATRPEPPGLCEYSSPREILSKEVPVGGSVIERPIRCIRGNQIIPVKTYRAFQNVTTEQLIVDLEGQKQNRLPGKQVYSDVTIQLPATIQPGLWRLVGYDEYERTGERGNWFSEAFRVTP